uniref:IA7 n=1 Tax=Globodera pallida TaxID=36090 RepID=Q1HEQ4_GLOPA|nr:IA7 [Globodera pallida]
MNFQTFCYQTVCVLLLISTTNFVASQAAVSTTKASASSCTDTAGTDQCNYYKRFCNRYKAMLKTMCPRTCKFC